MCKNLELLVISILVGIGIIYALYIVAEEKRKSIQRKSQRFTPFELAVLKHYQSIGYTYVTPRKFGGVNGQYLCDGVYFTGDGLPDLILDRPFQLFSNIEKKEPIEQLIKQSEMSYE